MQLTSTKGNMVTPSIQITPILIGGWRPCYSPSRVQRGEGVLCLSAHIGANGCCLCSYVCQIHLSTWKCWKTHSSPVFDKSYYKNILAHTFKKRKKKRKNFIPYFKTAVNTFHTSLFHNNNNNNIQTNLEHKLSKTN